MKKNYKLFLSLLLITFLYPVKIIAQQTIDSILPIQTAFWQNLDCGNVVQNSDTIRFYGSDYRIGGNLRFKGFFNFQNNAEVYIKWRFHSSYHEGIRVDIIGSRSYSYLSPSDISQDQWYYTHIIFDQANRHATMIVSTQNYDDQGGQIYNQWDNDLSDKQWRILSSSTVYLLFWDNYAGQNAYMDISEAKLVNVIPVHNDSEIVSENLYDFESGGIPNIIQPIENDWQIDTATGYNSNQSLFVEAPQGETRSAYMDLNNLVKVEFDVFTTSNTHKPIYFAMDSIGIALFNNANNGCWKHFVWRFNDNNPHRLYWRINGSSYDDTSGKLWIDNLKISYKQPNKVIDTTPTDFILYPNPNKGIVHIKQNYNRNLTFAVYDLSERIMVPERILTHQTIDLRFLKSGTYLIKFKGVSQGNQWVKRIFIQP